jgi:hypothetical protein
VDTTTAPEALRTRLGGLGWNGRRFAKEMGRGDAWASLILGGRRRINPVLAQEIESVLAAAEERARENRALAAAGRAAIEAWRRQLGEGAA